MRRNSFKVRPVGFTKHFPEADGNKRHSDISGGFGSNRKVPKAYAVSPRLLNEHENHAPKRLSSSVLATPLVRTFRG